MHSPSQIPKPDKQSRHHSKLQFQTKSLVSTHRLSEMAAFLPTTCFVPRPRRNTLSINHPRQPCHTAKPPRNLLRMTADKGEAASNDNDDQEVKEPYPGFLQDMQRMGLSEEDAKAQAKKQSTQSKPGKGSRVGGAKTLFKPDGTPYAPWMSDFPTEYDSTVIKKRTDATGRLAIDPQVGELSGQGMTWKMVGDDLELLWATGGEEGTVGFVLYRRAGKEEKWSKVADYRDSGLLMSKGPQGGTYSYLIEEPQPGTWVYRISDVNKDQNVTDLSQVLVEIDNPEDSKFQKVVLGALLAILAISVFIGLSLDPQS